MVDGWTQAGRSWSAMPTTKILREFRQVAALMLLCQVRLNLTQLNLSSLDKSFTMRLTALGKQVKKEKIMQVFYIHPKVDGYLIADGTQSNVLHVVDQEALKRLYMRIGAVLLGSADDGTLVAPEPLPEGSPMDMITSIEARSIAKAEGWDLPNTTLNSACERGTIIGAMKEHDAARSRWRMPRHEFMIWFQSWKVSKASGSKRGLMRNTLKAKE